jgi:predicted transcriptional regulator
MKTNSLFEVLAERTLSSGASSFEKMYGTFANTTSHFLETGQYALPNYANSIYQIKSAAVDFIPNGTNPLPDFILISFDGYQPHNSVTESLKSSNEPDQWKLLDQNTGLAISLTFATYSGIAAIDKIVNGLNPKWSIFSAVSEKSLLPLVNTILGIRIAEQAVNFYHQGPDVKLNETIAWASGELKWSAMPSMSFDESKAVTPVTNLDEQLPEIPLLEKETEGTTQQFAELGEQIEAEKLLVISIQTSSHELVTNIPEIQANVNTAATETSATALQNTQGPSTAIEQSVNDECVIRADLSNHLPSVTDSLTFIAPSHELVTNIPEIQANVNTAATETSATALQNTQEPSTAIEQSANDGCVVRTDLNNDLPSITDSLTFIVPSLILMALKPKTLPGSIMQWASGLVLVSYAIYVRFDPYPTIDDL